MLVVLGAVDGIKSLVDFLVVPLDGGHGLLGHTLEGVAGFSRLCRGSAAVAWRFGQGDRAGGDESYGGHCDVWMEEACSWLR